MRRLAATCSALFLIAAVLALAAIAWAGRDTPRCEAGVRGAASSVRAVKTAAGLVVASEPVRTECP